MQLAGFVDGNVDTSQFADHQILIKAPEAALFGRERLRMIHPWKEFVPVRLDRTDRANRASGQIIVALDKKWRAPNLRCLIL